MNNPNDDPDTGIGCQGRSAELQCARQHLRDAVGRSKDGVVMRAEQHAAAAVDHLRFVGCDEIAARVDSAASSGVARSDARAELREAMQLIDAEVFDDVNPEINKSAYVDEVSP